MKGTKTGKGGVQIHAGAAVRGELDVSSKGFSTAARAEAGGFVQAGSERFGVGGGIKATPQPDGTTKTEKYGFSGAQDDSFATKSTGDAEGVETISVGFMGSGGGGVFGGLITINIEEFSAGLNEFIQDFKKATGDPTQMDHEKYKEPEPEKKEETASPQS